MFWSGLLLFVLLISQCVESGISTTYTAPSTATFNDDEAATISYYYISTYSNPTFSGLKKLSSYAVITLQVWAPHTYSSDMRFLLYHPDGSKITISNRRGGSYKNVFDGTLFTDSAADAVATYPFTKNGVVTPLRPEDPLSTFRGKSPNGQWKFSVDDNYSSDDGMLNRVLLIIQDGCLIGNPCGSGTCVETGSTTHSCTCPTGYGGDGCVDVNECLLGTHNCNPQATCTNTVGSFTCACNPGYSGNGVSCSDVNECTLGTYSCITQAMCVNTVGSYTCACKPGYSGDGTSCTDINECLEGTDDCSENADCENTIGSYTCSCKDGFGGSGDSCSDVNECAGQGTGNNCTENAACTNLPGGFSCSCPSGFFGNGYISCTDYNECAGENGGNNCATTATCSNTPGSFSCICNSEYFGSGVVCIRTAIPKVTEVSSNWISISWSQSSGATGYQIAIVNSLGNLESTSSILSTTNYTFASLVSNTPYKFRLFTKYSTYADSRDISTTTFPSPVSGIVVDQVTSSSITFSMSPSSGAQSYSAKLFNENNELISMRSLEITDNASKKRDTKLKTSIDQLNPNQYYKIQVFANPEIVGVYFDASTFPAPPFLLQSTRINLTAVELSWQLSEGATKYRLTQTDMDGTLILSNDFEIVNSTNIYNLEESLEYIFTVYSGNSNGFDLSEGRSTVVSTSKVQCLSVIEDNAYWPPTTSGERTTGYCQDGYGGSPLRDCVDENQSNPNGVFSNITSPCIQFPDPVSQVQIIAKFDSADISWQVPNRALSYHVYLVLDDILLPINDGAGLNITTNEVTIYSLQEWKDYTLLIYAGNLGGFETTGKTISFKTPIAPPSNLITKTGNTWAQLSWSPSTLATGYSITIESENKRTETEVTQQTGTNFNITSLQPSTTYLLKVYSMNGNFKEPFGVSTSIKTLAGQDNQSQGPDPNTIIGIVVGIVGGFLVVLLLIIGLVLYRKRNSKETIELEQTESHSISFGAKTIDGSFQNPLFNQFAYPKRETTSDSTLMNTTLDIAIPGFLLLSGTQYRREGKFGSGGTGSVFSGVLLDQELVAQHETNKIAIKHVVGLTHLTDDESKAIFLHEVSMMWSCSFHPNVIKLVGYSLEPERCIVTKLYELDLFRYIHYPDEELPPLLILKLTNDIASGMASIQSLGIIHHDLKSANVLLEQVELAPGRYVLRGIICDFGLAKVAGAALAVGSHKVHEQTGLSPRYAAPEMFSKTRNLSHTNDIIDTKGDVYSLGIIIWEMLTRQIVWPGESTESIEWKVRSGTRPPIPEVPEDNPAAILLIELMQHCWKGDPHQRPSFQDITTKLSPLLNNW